MFDLIALAYQANMTRVFSMMMAAEVSNLTYNHIGVSDAFHPLSHHQNDPAKMDRLVEDPDLSHRRSSRSSWPSSPPCPTAMARMLDHSILLYGSNMSNSNLHNHYPLPSAVIGGGCGKIKGNQHLHYAERTPLANLLLTILDRANIPETAIGDSNAKFVEV